MTSETSGSERTCSLCDDPAVTQEVVMKEGTDESKVANLCEEHEDKLRRYNRGEEVDWNV